ncbi:MAG: ABC transporter permease [Meiothermus sp.]|nr:ABC transporter permease [Meiothermus sp.]
MWLYLLRRVLLIPPALLLISALVFAVVYLQPGNALQQYLEDPRFTEETKRLIERQYGLDQPPHIQYLMWLRGVVLGPLDFGQSIKFGRPVVSVLGEALGWTVFVALITIVFTWLIAIPLGIYTALNRYGPLSVVSNFVGYIGLAVPDFLVVLLLVAWVLSTGGTNVGGLFSPQFIDAPWGWAKFVNLMSHLWIPVVAIGLEGVAGLMRQMRSSMLDVLNQDYIRTARSKGLAARVVVYKHAVRNAINPMISLAGLQLPQLISSSIVVSIILNLPTIGPLLFDALIGKDQFLSMAVLMIAAFLLMVGNLLADMALAWADPRIRYD